MKIIILDDDGNTLLEEDQPDYIHLPFIADGKYDVECEDNDCLDPRCIERRDECERLLAEWRRKGQELAFAYHCNPAQDEKDLGELERLPNLRNPSKVRIYGFTRNEIVLSSGERLPFLLPHVNAYSGDQVAFSVGKWEAHLCPWRDEFAKKRTKSATK